MDQIHRWVLARHNLIFWVGVLPLVRARGVHLKKNKQLIVSCLFNLGGEGGIRTPGTREGTPHFECGPFNHSGTSPVLVAYGHNIRKLSTKFTKKNTPLRVLIFKLITIYLSKPLGYIPTTSLFLPNNRNSNRVATRRGSPHCPARDPPRENTTPP